LYKSDLATCHKKFIPNKNIGILEKKCNKKHISRIFKDYNEALSFQLRYGGRIYPITDSKTVAIQELDDIDNCMITKYKQTHGETIYVLVVNVQRELTEGFTPIKTLIYDIQILKIYRLYKLLVSMNVKPLGIKTDCIQIRESVKQLRKKATRANITSDVFKIKETNQTMPVKSRLTK